jgi:preprotein translocase subunit SecD
MKRKSAWILTFIFAFAVLAGFFVYPAPSGDCVKGLSAGVGSSTPAACGIFRNFGVNTFRPWKLGLDLVGGAHLTYEIDMKDVTSVDRDSVVNGLRDVIEKRVNLFGVSEPQVFSARSGEKYRLIVDLAGVKDITDAIKQIGETPFLLFSELKAGVATSTPLKDAFTPTELTGRYIVGATLNFDQITGKAQISLNFNDEGAKIFEEITGRNIGKQVAVFLDGSLITAPVVQQKISGGKAQITGSFTIDEAKLLVSRFNAGALPAPITLVSQQAVGATLGNDSLKRTIFAGVIGACIVMLFMILYYRVLGVFASAALLIYTIFTLAVFKLLGVTMSLSGIAGFILTIGMAVDANILIFERMKEEAKKGLSRIAVIEEGFKRAWLSIRDSNVSTILTAIILYYLTTGFIKGFGLSLFLGVVLSMFSAITVTRTMLRAFVKS